MGKGNKGNNGGGGFVPPSSCPVEGCKDSVKRFSFCQSHFEWFKEGLVNKRGEKPSDFDKKFAAYQRRKAA